VTAARELRVDGQVMRTLLQALQRCGFEPLRYVRGGAEAVRSLANPRSTVAWDDLVDTVERIEESLGQAELARVATAFTALHPAPRLLGGFLLPPRHCFRVLGSALAEADCLRVRMRELARGRFEFQVELEEGGRPSRVFFEACRHALAALPEVLGFEEPRLNVVSMSPTGAVFRVTPGRARGL